MTALVPSQSGLASLGTDARLGIDCAGLPTPIAFTLGTISDGICVCCCESRPSLPVTLLGNAVLSAANRIYRKLDPGSALKIAIDGGVKRRRLDRVGMLQEVLPGAKESALAALDAALWPGAPQLSFMERALGARRGAQAWDDLTIEVRTRSRFFSALVRDTLSSIFDQLDRIDEQSGKRVLAAVGPGCAISSLFRGRVAQTGEDLKRILQQPGSELGPPPPDKAGDGRMNPKGIPIFYGSMSRDTCIAELRPPVGSIAVTARFEICRPLTLLDLDALHQQVSLQAHPLDPAYSSELERNQFIREFVSLAQRPVLPRDHLDDYLPTQVVAEYLSEQERNPIDGMVYPSAQIRSGSPNVVLFNHASSLDLSSQSLRYGYVHTRGSHSVHDVREGIVVAEEDDGHSRKFENDPSPDTPRRSPALKLARDSIVVECIDEAVYKRSKVPVLNADFGRLISPNSEEPDRSS